MSVPDLDVLVIGAGPYGLSIAEELGASGASVVTVGEPFDLWHRHTLDSMALRSSVRASALALPGPAFDAFAGPSSHVPVTVYRRYLDAVAERLAVPNHRSRVLHLHRDGGCFSAACDDGARFTARHVVVATGPGPHASLPEALHALDPGRVVHTWDAPRVSRLAGRRVLVVGAGQSAAEAVAHLRGRNEVTWCLRRPPRFFRDPLRVPAPLFAPLMAATTIGLALPAPILRAVARWTVHPTVTPELRSHHRDARLPKIVGDVADLHLRERGQGLVARTGASFDLVVAATGYRPRVAALPFLSAEMARLLGGPADPPRVGPGFETPVPGLYLAGAVAEAAYGPSMRFLVGARASARILGRRLCSTGPRTRRSLAPTAA